MYQPSGYLLLLAVVHWFETCRYAGGESEAGLYPKPQLKKEGKLTALQMILEDMQVQCT